METATLVGTAGKAHDREPAAESHANLVAGGVATLAVVVSIGLYLRADRRLWFFGDDWDFLLHRSVIHDPITSLLTPHSEHWSTIPILIYRALYSMFGLRHFTPYILPVLLLHAGVCLLLWLLMRKAGAGPWSTASGVILMAICGGGVENLTWAFQVGFVGSIFFGLLALLLVGEVARWRIVLTWVAACCSLMCSGLGLPMLIGLGVYTVIHLGWRALLRVVGVPVLILVSWYAAYGQSGHTHDQADLAHRLQSAQYVWTGLTNVWQANTGIPNSGAVLLFAIAVPALIYGARDPLGRIAIALLAAATSVFVVAAWARVFLGPSEAMASRYVYAATALTVPAVVWLIERFLTLARRHTRLRTPVPVVLGIGVAVSLTSVNMTGYAFSFYERLHPIVALSHERVLATAELLREGNRVINPVADGQYSPVATSLDSADALAALPKVNVSAEALLEERGRIQVLVGPEVPDVAAAGTLTLAGQDLAPGAVCDRSAVNPGTTLRFLSGANGARISVEAPGSSLETSLSANGLTSSRLTTPISPEALTGVATSAAHVTVTVYFVSSGIATACLPGSGT